MKHLYFKQAAWAIVHAWAMGIVIIFMLSILSWDVVSTSVVPHAAAFVITTIIAGVLMFFILSVAGWLYGQTKNDLSFNTMLHCLLPWFVCPFIILIIAVIFFQSFEINVAIHVLQIMLFVQIALVRFIKQVTSIQQ
ncbi:MAG: hypothetical protein JNK61_07625 [Bacteroidia bacterium]|nr:hypothetical protein [Bacteroidia bacterium]HQV00253.1 hypothetical protein [Bacteroidia bacterium]